MSRRATFALPTKMRVATNTVGSMFDLYRTELGALFGAAEAKAMVRIVFQEAFGWDAAQLDMHRSTALSESELLKVYTPLTRLRTGEPLQYVLGHAWFMGMKLHVAPGVLIPRPETEEMVELIQRRGRTFKRIVDIGTGSGCIALGLKRSFPDAEVIAMDVSTEALTIACRNGTEQALNIDWQQCDVLSNEREFPRDLDLVVSNPPYVPRSEAGAMERHVLDHEPHVALFVDDADPLLFYRVIAQKARLAMVPGGEVWFEGHYSHSNAVGDMLLVQGYSKVEVLNDLSGSPRFIHAVR